MRRPRSLGAVTVVLALFVLSGLLRLGADAGAALAEADPAPREPLTECVGPPAALVAALEDREAKVAARESEAASRAAALDQAEASLSARLEQLAQAETTLSDTMARAVVAASGDVGRLVALYEAMKPQDAAGVIAQMPPSFAAGFVAEMQPEAGAAILAKLDPQIAFAISVEIAGRNARAPTE